MTNQSLEFWNQKHFEEDELAKMGQSSVFAKHSMQYFPKGGRILELAAGIGSDAFLFASQGFAVMATDFSQPALDKLKEKAGNNTLIETKQFDLLDSFPLEDQSFDAVYAHLALHYFNRQVTQQIFDEIYRVLKPSGVIAVLLNSKTDPEYETGEKLEDDYFHVPNKGPKRYFSVESLQPFTIKFKTIILDDKGSDPRRDHKEDLIRFIGGKV